MSTQTSASQNPPAQAQKKVRVFRFAVPNFRARWLQFVKNAQLVASVAWTLRASIGGALIASAIMAFPQQTLEALRVLAEDLPTRPFPAVAFAASVILCAAGLWVWGRIVLRNVYPPGRQVRDARLWAIRTVPSFCAIVFLFAVGVGLFRAGLRSPVITGLAARTGVVTSHRDWLLLLTSVVVMIESVLGSALVTRSKRTLGGVAWIIGRISKHPWLTFGISVLPGLVLLVWFSTSVAVAGRIGPVPIVLLAVTSWVAAASTAVIGTHYSKIPILTILLTAAVVFSWMNLSDNHEIRHTRAAVAAPPVYGDAFRQWLVQRSDLAAFAGRPYPVFIVAAEGGGIRAAYQTAIILSALQDICPSFAQHTFAISGVSGGSVGAAVFAAMAADSAANGPPAPCDGVARRNGWEDLTDSILKTDFLSPLLAAGLFPDLLQRFVPRPVSRFDRARALEGAMERAWRRATDGGVFGEPVDSLYTSRGRRFETSAVPALFLNTTNVETGERVVVSSLLPADLAFAGLRSLYNVDDSAVIALSTAAALSARFPGVTPSGFLMADGDDMHFRGKERFVDGGYFENSGLTTALEMLNAMRDAAADDSLLPLFEPIVIRIGFAAAGADLASNPGGGLNELSPLRTLLNTRSARGVLALVELRATVRGLRTHGAPAEMVEFVFRQERVPLPLGWLLSAQARHDMRGQVCKPPKALGPNLISNPAGVQRVALLLNTASVTDERDVCAERAGRR